MIVDPAVSRRKFAQEVEVARAQQHFHRQGIWILRSEYPIVFVAIVTPVGMPMFPGVLSAVHIDFTDYDVRPPSVYFVDPFSERRLELGEIKWWFPKATNVLRHPTTGQVLAAQPLNYVQGFNSRRPFLCLPGVREYHECSGHSGDSWFLHRGKMGNLLVHLLTMLQRYGSGAVDGVQFQVAQVFPQILQKVVP